MLFTGVCGSRSTGRSPYDDGSVRMPREPVSCPIALFVAGDDQPAARPRASGQLARVRHGVYAPAAPWKALKPWERYLVRVHALAAVRPGTVFCLESAASLFGLPVFGEPRKIHVFDTVWPTSHGYGDVVLHTSRDGRPSIQLGSLMVTSAASTVVDLVRVLPPAFGLAVADAAISPTRNGTCSIDELVALGLEQCNPRGRRRMDWVWSRADQRAESSGESVSRAVIEWLGFARPELQREFRTDGFLDRTDFFWPDYRVIGESDGYAKYDGRDKESVLAAIKAEKKREARLRRQSNGFARWDWASALQAEPLRAALLQEGLPLVSSPQPTLLATLRSNPRSLPPESSPENRYGA